MTRPGTVLEGITVLDLSRLMAGPYAAMALAHLGARVIKIESLTGEEGRGFGPPFNGELASLFLQSNRGKESLCLDFREPAGREVLEKLVRKSDVLIHSFRPDFTEATHLRYEDLAPLNARLVYYSVSAYGSQSPYRLKPSVDSVIQGVAGGFYGAGEAQDPPIRISMPIVDIASGMCGVSGILAALMEREQSQRGQEVELSLIQTMFNFLGSKIAEASREGTCERTVNPAIVAPSRHFQGSDQRWFTMTIINDAAFARLCRIISRPEWLEDERFSSNAARVRHRPELLTMLEQIFATRSASDWLSQLDQADIPAGPVNSVPDMLDDPVLSGLLPRQADIPDLPQPDFPVRLMRGMHGVDELARAPGIGEHSAHILGELGYGAAEISALCDARVTRLGRAPRLLG